MNNFWYWIIYNFVSWIVFNQLGIHLPSHNNWGLAAIVTSYGANLLTIMITFLGFFLRFETLGRVLPILLLLWLWKNKGNVLQIIAILRFFL